MNVAPNQMGYYGGGMMPPQAGYYGGGIMPPQPSPYGGGVVDLAGGGQVPMVLVDGQYVPAYGWGGLWKGIKDVGKFALKAAPVAAAFIPGIGPLAAGGIGALSGALSKKWDGGSWGDALNSGIKSGIGSYAGRKGVMGASKGFSDATGGIMSKLEGALGGVTGEGGLGMEDLIKLGGSYAAAEAAGGGSGGVGGGPASAGRIMPSSAGRGAQGSGATIHDVGRGRSNDLFGILNQSTTPRAIGGVIPGYYEGGEFDDMMIGDERSFAPPPRRRSRPKPRVKKKAAPKKKAASKKKAPRAEDLIVESARRAPAPVRPPPAAMPAPSRLMPPPPVTRDVMPAPSALPPDLAPPRRAPAPVRPPPAARLAPPVARPTPPMEDDFAIPDDLPPVRPAPPRPAPVAARPPRPAPAPPRPMPAPPRPAPRMEDDFQIPDDLPPVRPAPPRPAPRPAPVAPPPLVNRRPRRILPDEDDFQIFDGEVADDLPLIRHTPLVRPAPRPAPVAPPPMPRPPMGGDMEDEFQITDGVGLPPVTPAPPRPVAPVPARPAPVMPRDMSFDDEDEFDPFGLVEPEDGEDSRLPSITPTYNMPTFGPDADEDEIGSNEFDDIGRTELPPVAPVPAPPVTAPPVTTVAPEPASTEDARIAAIFARMNRPRTEEDPEAYVSPYVDQSTTGKPETGSSSDPYDDDGNIKDWRSLGDEQFEDAVPDAFGDGENRNAIPSERRASAYNPSMVVPPLPQDANTPTPVEQQPPPMQPPPMRPPPQQSPPMQPPPPRPPMMQPPPPQQQQQQPRDLFTAGPPTGPPSQFDDRAAAMLARMSAPAAPPKNYMPVAPAPQAKQEGGIIEALSQDETTSEVLQVVVQALQSPDDPQSAEIIAGFKDAFGEEALMELVQLVSSGTMAEAPMAPEMSPMMQPPPMQPAGPPPVAPMNLGGLISGNGDAMADDIITMADRGTPGEQKVAISSGEYVVAGDVVSGLGSGNTGAGAEVLDQLQDDVRMSRTGSPQQPPPIDLSEVLPRTYGEEYA